MSTITIPSSSPAVTALNGRFTFESFVVGSGNRLAYAAAKSVAETPGENYNPLYLYARPGLGKTHLLGALAHRVRSARPASAVLYVSGRALEEAAAAADVSGMLAGGLELLLLDDVQGLAGRRELQRELLRAAEAMVRARRQVVVTGELAPDRLAALEEPFRAFLTRGLAVDILNPDAETRAAILRSKLRERGQELPPDVVEELAARAFSSVTELEEMLDRVRERAEQNGTPPTVRDVQELAGAAPAAPGKDGGAWEEFQDFLSDVEETLATVLEENVSVRSPAAGAAAARAGGDGAFETSSSVRPAPDGTGDAGGAEPRAGSGDVRTLSASPVDPGFAPPTEGGWTSEAGDLPVPFPQYTFAGWVAAPGVRDATAAARGVLDGAAEAQVIVVHGPSGMGKTHLLNALGNALVEKDPRRRVACLRAEVWMREIAAADAEGALQALRERYGRAEALLLDGVEKLAGAVTAQRELVVLVDRLIGARAPVVATTSDYPAAVRRLEPLFAARLSEARLVEIEPLDAESTARLLIPLLRAQGVVIVDELARELSASMNATSVRELEERVRRAAAGAGARGAHDPAAGAGVDLATLRDALLTTRPGTRAPSTRPVDAFFAAPGKVLLHWEPLADRLVERLV